MPPVPLSIQALTARRHQFRTAGDYAAADSLRYQLLQAGYQVIDHPDGSSTLESLSPPPASPPPTHQLVVFGSGELSSVGRRIHESLIHGFTPPVRIALLETPAGYEANPHHWYLKLQSMLEQGLANYSPQIELVPALRRDGPFSTNDPSLLSPLLNAHYLHTGAGSPTYAVRHLRRSLALKYLTRHFNAGYPLSIASAAAMAFGRFTLPVYEIYFAGHDPFWINGLDFFRRFDLNLTFIPHWNNQEGGTDIDTRYAYMGQNRFNRLLQLLPQPTTIVGIDEHTALSFNFTHSSAEVLGKGSVTLRHGQHTTAYSSGSHLSFSEFQL